MLRVSNQDELQNLFRDFEKDQVILPSNMSFPLAVSDYLAWKEPSGHRTFLVVEDKVGDRPFGLIFERTKGTESVPMMCNWCHAVKPASDVALMTVAVDKRTRVGVYLCSDISCKDNILERPSIHDMRETLGKQEKLVRLQQKIQDFANHEIL